MAGISVNSTGTVAATVAGFVVGSYFDSIDSAVPVLDVWMKCSALVMATANSPVACFLLARFEASV